MGREGYVFILKSCGEIASLPSQWRKRAFCHLAVGLRTNVKRND